MRVLKGSATRLRWVPIPTDEHFVISPGTGPTAWVIAVYRLGYLPEVIEAGSLPEAHRLGRRLADGGLVGWVNINGRELS